MFAEYTVFIIYSSCNSLLFDLRWWRGDFVWIGLWRLKFAAPLPQAGFNLLTRAREIPSPPHILRSPARVVTYANLFTRREQMSRVGQQSNQRQQYSTGHNPVQCKQISLIHIIQNHNKTLLQLLNMTPESPTNNNQINALHVTALGWSHQHQPRRCRVTSLVSVCRWPQLNNFIPTRNLLHNPCSPLKRI